MWITISAGALIAVHTIEQAADGRRSDGHLQSRNAHPAADHKRRDAMAMAAAPYLHSRPTAIDAKLSPEAAMAPPQSTPSMTIEFVMPSGDHARDDRD
jgi:hypothetical protein